MVASTRNAVGAARTVRELFREVETAIRPRMLPETAPEFAVKIGWAASYDALFRNSFYQCGQIDTLVSKAADSGRVLIAARGGSGKTQLLYRLAISAGQKASLPIFLDLSSWSLEESTIWTETGSVRSARMDYLLGRFAIPKVSLARLDSLPVKLNKIVLVDGLSEIRAGVGDEVLTTLDDLVSEVVGASLIAADRLVRREFRDSSRWGLATLLPLEVTEVTRHLRSNHLTAPASGVVRSILREPFFLDATLRKGIAESTSTRGLRSDFVAIAKLSMPEFDRAASAGLKCYQLFGFRSFRLDVFEREAGEETVNKLTSAGLLVTTKDGRAHFAHQLHHDFLAASSLALHEDQWSNSTFDAVSLGASSFDTIAMVLEQLSESAAEKFLRRVYDWNPYAAAYAMAECERRGTLTVAVEMQAMLLAMLAHRRWDPIVASAIRAQDALSVFPSSLAKQLLMAPSLEEVFRLVSELESKVNWFNEWRKQFTKSSGSQATQEDVEGLLDTDSIGGWTMANVIKRLSLSPSQLDQVKQYASTDNETVKWRVAHVLGSFPTKENADFLMELWHNSLKGSWVRYGAIRSLLEMAAITKDPALTSHVIGSLLARSQELLDDRRSLAELARSVVIRPDLVSKTWITSVTSLVRTLYEYSADDESREKWRGIAVHVARMSPSTVLSDA